MQPAPGFQPFCLGSAIDLNTDLSRRAPDVRHGHTNSRTIFGRAFAHVIGDDLAVSIFRDRIS